MAWQPAVLGSARLNNFRLNYLTAALAGDRPFHLRVILGGVDMAAPGAPTRFLHRSMTIRDLVFDAPNTCALTCYGLAPAVGARLEVWINSNAPVLLFGGELQTVDRTFKGTPATVVHPCTAIDDTARANRRRPLGAFVNTSASAIAAWLVSTYAPGYSSAGVEPGLPAVTITFDGSEAGMKGCLTAIAKLIGGYWYFENRTLYLFLTPPGPAPDPIDDTPGRFLHEPAITWTIDKSQVRTRVYGKGAGARLLTSTAAGTDLLPIEDAVMFQTGGGRAIVGTTPEGAAWAVVAYTGVTLGGGGGLVGPGAAPAAPLGLAAVDGSGIESGVHRYAVTYQTAAGESLSSPVASVTVGLTSPPALAPVPGAATVGGAIDPGWHYYAVTFVTAAGETTTPGVTQGVETTKGSGVPVPAATGLGAWRNVAGNLAVGVAYAWKTTFTIAGGGETTPGPSQGASSPIAPAPLSIEAYIAYDNNAHMEPGDYYYRAAYVAGGYATGLGPGGLATLPGGQELYNAMNLQVHASPDARVTSIRIYRTPKNNINALSVYLVATVANATAVYKDMKADSAAGGLIPVTSVLNPSGTPPGDQASLTIPTSTDARVTGRKIYRSDNGAPYRYVGSVGNNSTLNYTDNAGNISGNADAPTVDTSGAASYQTVPLSGIAIGPAHVTARRIYRSEGELYRLVATIANNTQTIYTDTAATSALGAYMPTVNTAAANRVLITLPIGPAAVTARRLYRSAANLEPLKFLGPIANNTQTTYTDTETDVNLGAAVPPAVDTSGLTQPNGQVPPGSTSMLVANAAPFASAGGWAVVGNGEQVIRYTGKTATTLEGIPATGPGALVAAVSFSSTVTTAPALVGVTGAPAMTRGAPVTVWVERNDLDAQAYLIALDGGGDGVYEHIVRDERRSEASLRQMCDAELALYSRPLVTVTYATRDLKTKSGKTVTIALASPAIAESLTIQDVTISEIGTARRTAPKFTVTASSVHHTFEAILRMLIRKAEG